MNEILNLSLNNNNVCVLNQVAMLNELEKIPVNIIILMALSFLAIMGYIYIMPFFKKNDLTNIISDSLVLFSGSLQCFAIILLAAITFDIKETTWNYILYIMIILAIIWFIIFGYIKRDKIKEILREVKL